MIKSFADKDTEALWRGETPRRLAAIASPALRKLDMLDAAVDVIDLRSPPGNRLEALKGNRQGQHSIRVNDQWRVCFVWDGDGAAAVEIVDYH
jgi:proteic killer suppression protein